MAKAYTLTLTREERRAMDWIGNRYPHGYDLSEAIMAAEVWRGGDEWGWFGDETITFYLSESEAWHVADIIGSSQFECFSDELRDKLIDWVAAIV